MKLAFNYKLAVILKFLKSKKVFNIRKNEKLS
jgi:hypothetical protein